MILWFDWFDFNGDNDGQKEINVCSFRWWLGFVFGLDLSRVMVGFGMSGGDRVSGFGFVGRQRWGFLGLGLGLLGGEDGVSGF
ncbi:hypothetical protein LWI28_006031 [Acer negundo]|uniref:Uncharacterized protein n=1 Tax=Acer negundo TaxID=4023 RepID=A0AAD5IPA3_ACENE|nr:hypothetical protein LWI28_006031 [Acer negundo]